MAETYEEKEKRRDRCSRINKFLIVDNKHANRAESQGIEREAELRHLQGQLAAEKNELDRVVALGSGAASGFGKRPIGGPASAGVGALQAEIVHRLKVEKLERAIKETQLQVTKARNELQQHVAKIRKGQSDYDTFSCSDFPNAAR